MQLQHAGTHQSVRGQRVDAVAAAIHDENLEAGPGQQHGRGGTGRTGADDDRVVAGMVAGDHRGLLRSGFALFPFSVTIPRSRGIRADHGYRLRSPGPARQTVGVSPVEPPLGSEMTAREAEVLSLLAQHLTNVQIAETLFISVRTVESHVSALLRKFQLPDRRSLARRAEAELDPLRPPASVHTAGGDDAARRAGRRAGEAGGHPCRSPHGHARPDPAGSARPGSHSASPPTSRPAAATAPGSSTSSE